MAGYLAEGIQIQYLGICHAIHSREKHSGSLGGAHQVIFPMAMDDSPFTMLASRREIQCFELNQKTSGQYRV